MAFMEEVGKLIKYVRLKEGLTQEELADKAGVSISTIQKIEQQIILPRYTTIFYIFEYGIDESMVRFHIASALYLRGIDKDLITPYLKTKSFPPSKSTRGKYKKIV